MTGRYSVLDIERLRCQCHQFLEVLGVSDNDTTDWIVATEPPNSFSCAVGIDRHCANLESGAYGISTSRSQTDVRLQQVLEQSQVAA
jgi:hypothetical protein